MKKFFEDAVGKMNDGFGVWHHLTTGYEIRPYQQKLIQEVKDTLKEKGKCVLGATCGAGKTYITTKIIEDFIIEHPDAKVLILTHGRTQLRSQFYDRLLESELLHPEVAKFTSEDEECPTKQVVVALPHVHKKDLPNFDLVVVDEAHHYYKAKMVQTILKKVKPKQLLLLTGSPSYFVKKNFPRVLLSAQELREAQSNVLADVTAFIVQTAYDFKQTDYTEKRHLRDNVPIDIDDTRIALSRIIETLLKALQKNVGENPHLFNGGDNVYQKMKHYIARKELGKTIITCTSIKQSEQVCSILTEQGVSAVLSHSKNDVDSLKIGKFRKEPDIQILVVVDRGTVGFDLPELKNFIDLSATENPDTLFQMLGRVSRNDQSGQTKVFIKASPKNRVDRVELVTCFALALSLKKVFNDYDGYYTKFPPPIRRDRKNTGEKREGNSRTRKAEEQPDVIDLDDYTEQLLTYIKHQDDSPAPAVAWVTLNDEFRLKPTLEECQEEAGNHANRNIWGIKDQRTYRRALKQDWLDLCLPRIQAPKLTFEDCFKDAEQYTHRDLWQRASKSAYTAATREGWLDACCAHMPKPPEHTFQSCFEDAAQYKRRADWKEKSGGKYTHAQKKGWLDACCAHMPKNSKVKYNDEQLLEAFRLRFDLNIPHKQVADQLGIEPKYLGKVFKGKYRADVLKTYEGNKKGQA